MLVVVHHRDVELGDQALFDLETARRRNVLEVDAAEDRRDELHRLDDLLGILGVETDGEGVDAAELLEEYRLAFHDGERRFRSEVAEAENSRAVGDDRDGVGFDGVLVSEFFVRANSFAHGRDARRVGAREVVAIGERHLALGFHLAVIALV